jgi:excinuclease UvrABC nuclease subunit
VRQARDPDSFEEMSMKNLIWILVAAVVLGGGYLLFSGKSVDEVVESISPGATEVEAPAALEDAAAAVGEAAEAAADTAAEAVEAATEAASDAAEAVSETASEAVEAATTTEESAAEAVESAQDAAAEAAADAVSAAVDQPATAAEVAPEALTVEGFDLTQVQTLIEGSDVSPLQKTMLLEGVKAAQDNPELLRAALEAARAALGY